MSVNRQARKCALKSSAAWELGRAEEWQRAQVWAAWEAVQSGHVGEVSWDEIEKAVAPHKQERGA